MEGKGYQRPSTAQGSQEPLVTHVVPAEIPEVDDEAYGEPEEPLPWDGVVADNAPRDHPFYTSIGINRFRDWTTVDPPEAPTGPWPPPTDHRGYRELLEAYCRTNFDDPEDLENLEQRLTLYNDAVDRRAHPPSWMTLELGEESDMRQWSGLVRELQIDAQAQQALKNLADDPSGWGPFEVNRILAHLFKDTSSAILGSEDLPRKSAWVMHACNEAMAAIRNPQEWDCEHQVVTGLVWTLNPSSGRWAWHAAPRGSSSTSTWRGDWSHYREGMR